MAYFLHTADTNVLFLVTIKHSCIITVVCDDFKALIVQSSLPAPQCTFDYRTVNMIVHLCHKESVSFMKV